MDVDEAKKRIEAILQLHQQQREGQLQVFCQELYDQARQMTSSLRQELRRVLDQLARIFGGVVARVLRQLKVRIHDIDLVKA
jgi:hypothetical protein